MSSLIPSGLFIYWHYIYSINSTDHSKDGSCFCKNTKLKNILEVLKKGIWTFLKIFHLSCKTGRKSRLLPLLESVFSGENSQLSWCFVCRGSFLGVLLAWRSGLVDTGFSETPETQWLKMSLHRYVCSGSFWVSVWVPTGFDCFPDASLFLLLIFGPWWWAHFQCSVGGSR